MYIKYLACHVQPFFSLQQNTTLQNKTCMNERNKMPSMFGSHSTSIKITPCYTVCLHYSFLNWNFVEIVTADESFCTFISVSKNLACLITPPSSLSSVFVSLPETSCTDKSKGTLLPLNEERVHEIKQGFPRASLTILVTQILFVFVPTM